MIVPDQENRPMNDVPTATAAPPASNASSGTPTGTGPMSSPRLAEFNEEVGKLKVTGGGANSEKLGAMWGIGLTIVGFVISVLSWWSALDATNEPDIIRSTIPGVIGVGLAIVGIAMWVRNSLTRYLRYWIVRLVYKQREQTDAIVQALKEK
jgi:hypothetical protein